MADVGSAGCLVATDEPKTSRKTIDLWAPSEPNILKNIPPALRPKGISLEIGRQKRGPYKLIFGPALGLGTKVLRASHNGRNIQFRISSGPLPQAVQPVVETTLSLKDTIEIELEPAVEILPPDNESKTGDLNWGLRIIKMEQIEHGLKIIVEGLSGQAYILQLTHPELIRSTSGAKLESAGLHIQIPQGIRGEYVRHAVMINLK
jgi:hypothetical protein